MLFYWGALSTLATVTLLTTLSLRFSGPLLSQSQVYIEIVMNFLDVDDQPPYVEVYSHHPLMYLSLTDYQKQACQQVSPRELLYWCHAVQCKIDDVAGRLGLCKMKIMGQFGPSCMFTISPDMPPKQQADVLLTAAQLLRATLSKVIDGGRLTLICQWVLMGSHCHAATSHQKQQRFLCK